MINALPKKLNQHSIAAWFTSTILALCTLLTSIANAQTNPKPLAKNIIIVTLDGMRWQEVFNGMDTSIADQKQFIHDDSAYTFHTYWDESPDIRRKKLFPFLWSAFVQSGRLYGNRNLENNVNVANPYFFSYPGYHEIFTGFADTAVNSNDYPPNPHLTLLAYLAKQNDFKGRVAAFGSWEAYSRILDAAHCGFPVAAGFKLYGFSQFSAGEKLVNKMRADSYSPDPEEGCMDVFTQYGAMEYLKANKPRVLYIAFLETDAWAHEANYRNYLDAAHHADSWLKELWETIQSDPFYRGNTALLVTTDHGRGLGNKWTSHGGNPVASQIWFGLICPGLPQMGEMKGPQQLYQQQLAQTIAGLLGQVYRAPHPIGNAIDLSGKAESQAK